MSWDNIDFDAFYAEVKESHREEELTPAEGWLTVEEMCETTGASKRGMRERMNQLVKWGEAERATGTRYDSLGRAYHPSVYRRKGAPNND